MKKAAIILVLLLSSLLFGWAQDLSVIKNGSNYLLVKAQKSQKTEIDSTQLKRLTVTTFSTEFIPVSSVESEVKNLDVLNKLIANNYELIQKGNILETDSVINKYNISEPWLKERARRIYVVKEENDIITCRLTHNSKSIMFNFEFALLLLSMIFIIYLNYSNLKMKKYLEIIIIGSSLLIIFISQPYPDFLTNIINSILMTMMFLLALYIIAKIIEPIIMPVVLAYSLMSGYMQHDKLFGLSTLAIGLITMAICWAIKLKTTPPIILEPVSKIEK